MNSSINASQPTLGFREIAWLILLYLAGTTATFACSCVEINSSLKTKVKSNFETASFIFTGLLVGKELIQTNEHYETSMDPVIYTFDAIEYFKGNALQRTIEVISERDGASCGYNFQLGQTYLVHAWNYDTHIEQKDKTFKLRTGLCSRNKVRRNVTKKELRVLRRLFRRSKRQFLKQSNHN